MNKVKCSFPKRRFKEFRKADVWDQRKLSELSYVFDGTHQTPHYTDRGVMFLSVENIGDMKSEKYISEKDFQEEFKIYPENGDILMTRIGDIGTANIYTSNQPVAYYVSLALLKKRELDPYYLKAVISCNYVQKELWNRTLHIAFPKKINKNEIEKVLVPYPVNKKEQEKIGKLFKNINNLISLHQHKLEKMKALKKSYLSEMFPVDGESKPKRRFTGFTDKWETLKFTRVFNYLQNNSLSRSQLNYEEGKVLNIHYGDILILYGECLDVKKEVIPRIGNNKFIDKYNASYLKNGDIIIADAAEDQTVGKCCEIKGLQNEKILSGLHTIPCRPMLEFATGYLGYFMNSNSYHDQLLPLMQGTKVSSISKSSIANTYIKFPKDIKEQVKIGSYFIELDNLISLQQKKVDKLKNMKKAYLNELFI